MTSTEKKEQMFELYIDDLRYLGAEIPTLHWNVDADGDIYLLWGKIGGELHKHLAYADYYMAKIDEFVNYFNLTHQITDEDL
jgi:hypothetical protein